MKEEYRALPEQVWPRLAAQNKQTKQKTILSVVVLTLGNKAVLYCEAFGSVVRGRSGFDSPLRISFLFCTCRLWTLSCDFARHNEQTFNMSLLLIQNHSGGDSVAVGSVSLFPTTWDLGPRG